MAGRGTRGGIKRLHGVSKDCGGVYRRQVLGMTAGHMRINNKGDRK